MRGALPPVPHIMVIDIVSEPTVVIDDPDN